MALRRNVLLACLLGVLTLAASLVVVLGGAGTSSAAADRDCGDFATQAAAQQYFLSLGGPAVDPDRLDADGDGVVCESNPCPCSTAQHLSDGGGSQPVVRRQHARIVHVTDGDTVVVRIGGGPKVRVRLLGIDTPEVYGQVECGGPQASALAKRLLPRGTRVTLVSDPSQANKDRYGRLLRYVMKGTKDIGRAQLVSGWARVYVYAHHPFRRVRTYRAAATAARNHDRGIWGHC